MSDLEAFGRHVGSVRVLEPVTVFISCHYHKTERLPVAVLPDEGVAVCCFFATLNVSSKLMCGLGKTDRWILWPL